jgi:hypothetical protein
LRYSIRLLYTNLHCQYLPSNHYQIAESLNDLDIVHEDKRNYYPALEYCKQALAILEKNYSGDHLNKAKKNIIIKRMK